jgi:hypothetical protein
MMTRARIWMKSIMTPCSGNGNTLGVSVDSSGVLGKNDKEIHGE